MDKFAKENFQPSFEKSLEEKTLILDPVEHLRNEILSNESVQIEKWKEQSNENLYEGKKFEYECWNFFYNLNPDCFNHPFKEFKFDLTEYRNTDEAGKRAPQGTRQTDLCFIYGKHVFIIECKSTSQKTSNEKNLSSKSLDKEIEKFRNLIDFKTRRVHEIFGQEYIPVFILCIKGFDFEDAEQEKWLKKNDIIILDEKRRGYIEEVFKESGSAEFSLNQFLGFFRKNKPDFNEFNKKGNDACRSPWVIDGYHSLSGAGKKNKVYTFSIAPNEMLKVSTVAHQRINNIFNAEDSMNKKYYQRLLKKSRLSSLGEHLEKNNTPFPNNILVSYRGEKPIEFESSNSSDSTVGNSPGTITFDACPGTFHVIDGQHRLFGYTNTEKKPGGIRETHRILVTAFSGLSLQEEAEIFLEVNQNAKPISAPLIMEIEWASGAKTFNNFCTGVVFSLRDDEGSFFNGIIKNAEGKGSIVSKDKIHRSLAPKNLQTAIGDMKYVSEIKNDKQKFEPSFFKEIDKLYELIDFSLRIFFEKNKKRWKSVDRKNKKKNGALQNILIAGLIGVIDRVLMHCYNQGHKFTVETLKKKMEPYLKNMADKFAATDKMEVEEINKILDMDFFGAGAAAPGVVTAYFVNQFFDSKFSKHLIEDNDEEKISRLIQEGLTPEEVDKLIKDKAQLEKDLKKALENDNYKNIPQDINKKATRICRILKNIVHLSLVNEKHFGISYWSSYVFPAFMGDDASEENVYRQIYERWNKEKSRYGEYAYQHPIPHVEAGPLARLISEPKKIRKAILVKNQEERIERLLNFLWKHMIIYPQGEKQPKKYTEDSKVWKKGLLYVELFFDFRNYDSEEGNEDAPHGRVKGVEGNPLKLKEDQFNYYYNEFNKRIQGLAEELDLEGVL